MLRSLTDHLASITDHLWPWSPIWIIFGLTRLTQVVQLDRIFDDPRKRWLKRVNPNNYQKGDPRMGLWAYMLMCIFCLSLDLGLLVMLIIALPIVGHVMVLIMVALAASYFVPLLHHWQNKLLKDEPPLTEDEIAAWRQEAESSSEGEDRPTLAEEVAGITGAEG